MTHRSFRLPPPLLEAALEPAWELIRQYGATKTELALSFILSFPEISTVIPGIRTPEQAKKNTSEMVALEPEDRQMLQDMYEKRFLPVVDLMQQAG